MIDYLNVDELNDVIAEVDQLESFDDYEAFLEEHYDCSYDELVDLLHGVGE